MEQYLRETPYFDYSSEVIQKIISELDLEGLSEKDKAIKLFYYVRDSIAYSIKPVNLEKETYTASHVLQQDKSFCIPKAIALGTLARGVGIPSRIHFVDFLNHRLSDELEKFWGTKIMAAHCYTELYIDEKWVKATPALDSSICDRHNFITVEFDGENDALLHAVDRAGQPHAEYVNDRGVFADMDIPFVAKVFSDVYSSDQDDFLEINAKASSKTFS